MFVGVFLVFSIFLPFVVAVAIAVAIAIADVHLARPQTQHALNFASHHNAAVKLITSLECKN